MQIGQQSQTTTEKENVPPHNLKGIPNISKSLFNNDKRAKGAASSKKYISQQQLVAKTRSGRKKTTAGKELSFCFCKHVQSITLSSHYEPCFS